MNKFNCHRSWLNEIIAHIQSFKHSLFIYQHFKTFILPTKLLVFRGELLAPLRAFEATYRELETWYFFFYPILFIENNAVSLFNNSWKGDQVPGYKLLNCSQERLISPTFQNINIISPRSSFSIPASVRSPVFSICSISILRWRTPPLMLHGKHSVASFLCSQSAFLNSISPSAVMSFQKATFAF